MHAARAMAAKVTATLGGQINPVYMGAVYATQRLIYGRTSGGRRTSNQRWAMGPFMLYVRGERLGL